MGQINGIYYWQTRNCPDNGSSGFAQTLTNLPAPCCSNSTGSWVCNCGVSVAMSAVAPGEAVAQTQQAEQKYVLPSSEVSIVASPACALAQGTEAEANTKLQAIIAELQAKETYLQELAASSEVQNSDPKNQKSRIKVWLITVAAMLNYLSNGSDTAAVKITNYCDKFLSAELDHQRLWDHATLPLGNGKTQQISNEQQTGPLVQAITVDVVDKGANVTVVRGPVVRVNVANVSAVDKKAYFQTFKIFLQPTGQPISSLYVGVQVEEPMSGVIRNAGFIDRHNFGHKIRIPATGETFLVSSHDDLGISK